LATPSITIEKLEICPEENLFRGGNSKFARLNNKEATGL
jgi:hypothetical protein